MQKKEIIIALVVVILAVAIADWYVWSVYQQIGVESPVPLPQTAPIAAPSAPASEAKVTTSSLGASILEKARNPLQNKVPEVSPTANPVKNVYNNPFE